MNNPHNKEPRQRAITPCKEFGLGINHKMSKERRKSKQARHRANASKRQMVSKNVVR